MKIEVNLDNNLKWYIDIKAGDTFYHDGKYYLRLETGYVSLKDFKYHEKPMDHAVHIVNSVLKIGYQGD